MTLHQPLRTCIACREKKNKQELLRIVRTPEKNIEIDETAQKSGRGAYLCYKIDCFQLAIKRKSIERTLNTDISPGFLTELTNLING